MDFIKVFSLDQNGAIKHVINFPQIALIHNSKTEVSIELSGLYWFNHAQKCDDCKALMNSFGKDHYQWVIEIEDEMFFLKLRGFKPKHEHFKNFATYESTSEFEGTKLKFMLDDKANINSAQKLLKEKEKLEEYEACSNIQNFIKTKK